MHFKFLRIILMSLIFIFCTATSVSAGNTSMAMHEISLNNRYGNESVNNIFKNNILLSMAYISGKVHRGEKIDWTSIKKPFHYEFRLKPGESFAFHNDIIDFYNKGNVVTGNSHFSGLEGYESDGYLYGDGVCHLASLMNWVAQDAGLDVYAPTRHDFAVIPDIPRQYGVSIYYSPGQSAVNKQQNLYIENNYKKPILFVFDYKNNSLKTSVVKVN